MRNFLQRQKAACLRADGFTYRAVARALGVSLARATDLARLGRNLAEPDEVVFLPSLKPTTPTQKLPVSKLTRDALMEAGIAVFGDLLNLEPQTMARTVLCYPNLGRAKLEELERVLFEWRSLRDV